MTLAEFIKSINNMTVTQLQRIIYKHPVYQEDSDDITGGFSLVCIEGLKYGYGVSFIGESKLQIFDFFQHKVVLDCDWDEDHKTWKKNFILDTDPDDITLSDIVTFSKTMRQFLK